LTEIWRYYAQIMRFGKSDGEFFSFPYNCGMPPSTNKTAHAFRRGPSPLPLTMGFALNEYRALEAGGVGSAELAAMMEGIRKYQDHPFRRKVPLYETIWQSGEARLLRHKRRSAKANRAPLLLIPSLINGSAILDLLPRRSFMRHLEQQGHDAILLDWGKPQLDPAMKNSESLILNRLIPAMDYMRDRFGQPAHMLGYCMGGLLLLAALSLRTELGGRIALLGAPWDFHGGDRRMLNHVAAGTPAAYQAISDRGYLPAQWIQSIFAAMNADRAGKKFAGFATMNQDSAAARLFVAVEDWLNDGIDLPAAFARDCITDWYGQNTPGTGGWMVQGRAIDPSAMTNHILVVAAKKDRLVPPESSTALMKRLRHGQALVPDTGHIGMMAGRNAKRKVWTPVSDWLLSTG
jgi:polyhydroxyalkanoate synthase